MPIGTTEEGGQEPQKTDEENVATLYTYIECVCSNENLSLVQPIPEDLLLLFSKVTFYNVCPSHVCVSGRISPLRGLIGRIDRLLVQ